MDHKTSICYNEVLVYIIPESEGEGPTIIITRSELKKV